MTLATFIFFTALVAVLTWWLTLGKKNDTDDGFFLAGRGLTGIIIAGSLLLTNLSTEQLVGLNAGSFNEGLSVMAWEVIAGFSLVILALVFLPRYLKSGITTIPQFMEERYDGRVRALTSVIFIIAYCVILLPFVLYTAAKGLIAMLQLTDATGMGEYELIWAVISFIAVVGGAYAIFGGLRAVAVSDTLNGAGLLVGSSMITIFAVSYISQEVGLVEAFKDINARDSDAFNSLGVAGEDVPWHTLLSGVFLINFFYWCTNQQIIQRTFAAKNLAEGQKGVLLASFFKILAPLVLVLPGIVAAHIAANSVEFEQTLMSEGDVDAGKAYGALVNLVLPKPLTGFFAAVIVGSILSTFNSVLNSCATLFSLDIYKKYVRPEASQKQVVFAGQICSIAVAIFAVVMAPNIFYGREKGLFGLFQGFNSLYFIPLLAIIMIGFFNRNANGTSAIITVVTGLVLMLIGMFAGGDEKTGWLISTFKSGYHYAGAVFVLLVVLQIILGQTIMKRDVPFVQKDAKVVDLTPWKPAKIVGGALITLSLLIYIVFAS